MLLCAIVGTAAVSMANWDRQVGREGQPTVMLLYVGAEDCGPCRAWQKGDGADFLASGEFARITYREVRSPHLEDVLNDENWPQDLRDYRSRIRPSDGVPLWLVISGHEVVDQQFGTAAWLKHVVPKLRSYQP